MGRVAVFMGAGASKPFGYPLTSELLPVIREALNAGTAFERPVGMRKGVSRSDKGRRKNRELSALLRRMLPGFRAQRRLPNITDVLSLIDYSILVGNASFPRAKTQELVRLRLLLEEAIFNALWPSYQTANPPIRLKRIASWFLRGKPKSQEMALISTTMTLRSRGCSSVLTAIGTVKSLGKSTLV